MAAEFLCKRWTVLIFLELLHGSTSFNDICRGVPRMSRTLLSKRLKEFEQRGLINKVTRSYQRESEYTLTLAGKALNTIVVAMGDWGQEWLHVNPSLEDIDTDHLLWKIKHNACPQPGLPNPFVAHIVLSDQPESRRNGWLVIEDNHVEMCVIDHDFVVDVQIEASARDLAKIIMGWSDFAKEIEQGNLKLSGPKQYTKSAKQWLGQSRVAGIKKQPEELRVY